MIFERCWLCSVNNLSLHAWTEGSISIEWLLNGQCEMELRNHGMNHM